MASLIFNSWMDDVSNGNVKATDTFYGMLVDSTYTPNKDTHTKRSDVTGEIAGTGYTAGGAVTACTPSLDTSVDQELWTFADIAWAAATITNARAVVVYKHRGGAASADELVFYGDFGANQSSVAATFTAHFTSALIIQN